MEIKIDLVFREKDSKMLGMELKLNSHGTKSEYFIYTDGPELQLGYIIPSMDEKLKYHQIFCKDIDCERPEIEALAKKNFNEFIDKEEL